VPGATIFGCLGTKLNPAEKDFFRDADPFGFILFARNLETPEQIRKLCAEMRQTVGRDAPIFIDQEGGRVARLRPPLGREWVPALEQVEATLPGQAAQSMYLRSRLIAEELRALGIDGNCVPIVDVPAPEVHEIIRNRCYGTNPEDVARIGRAVADGCLHGGVLPVLKHIPGHGRPNVDSHMALPTTNASPSALREVDFAPFKALCDLPLGMTAHVVYEAFDKDNCATFSLVVLALVREEIGFQGLLMSDDISMGALSGSFTERSQRALAAGCDVILHCHGHLDEMTEIAGAASVLSGKALARADAALSARQTPDSFDPKQALAQLAGLLSMPRNEQPDPA